MLKPLLKNNPFSSFYSTVPLKLTQQVKANAAGVCIFVGFERFDRTSMPKKSRFPSENEREEYQRRSQWTISFHQFYWQLLLKLTPTRHIRTFEATLSTKNLPKPATRGPESDVRALK